MEWHGLVLSDLLTTFLDSYQGYTQRRKSNASKQDGKKSQESRGFKDECAKVTDALYPVRKLHKHAGLKCLVIRACSEQGMLNATF